MTYLKTDPWHTEVLNLKTFQIKISHDKKKKKWKTKLQNKFQAAAVGLPDSPPNHRALFGRVE